MNVMLQYLQCYVAIILCYNAKISIDNTGLNRDLDNTLHELLSGDVASSYS